MLCLLVAMRVSVGRVNIWREWECSAEERGAKLRTCCLYLPAGCLRRLGAVSGHDIRSATGVGI